MRLKSGLLPAGRRKTMPAWRHAHEDGRCRPVERRQIQASWVKQRANGEGCLVVEGEAWGPTPLGAAYTAGEPLGQGLVRPAPAPSSVESVGDSAKVSWMRWWTKTDAVPHIWSRQPPETHLVHWQITPSGQRGKVALPSIQKLSLAKENWGKF